MAPNRKTGQKPLAVLGQRQPGPVVLDPTGRSLSLTYEQFAALLAPYLEDVLDTGGGGGHLHGLMRLLGDGSTVTFELLDFVEYLEHVGVNGSFRDPAAFTLSADRSQITFDAAPGAGQIVTLEYVIAGL